MTGQTRGKERKRPAPLVSWVWALAIIGLLASRPPEILGIEVPPSEAFQAYNSERLRAFAESRVTEAAASPRPLRVISLGNSRLKHATFDDQVFTEFAATRGKEGVEYLRIVNNWAVFKNFEPIADQILAAEPDVVLLQLELLGLERGPLGRTILTREYLIWRLAGFGPWNPRNVDQGELQFNKPCTNVQTEEALWRRLERTYDWLEDNLDAESPRLAREFIAKAVAKNITVVLLGIPMTERMEQERRSNPEHLLEIAQQLEAEAQNIAYLNYPGSLPDDRYCDFVHMNKQGREEYSSWILGELARLAQTEGSQPRPQAAEVPGAN